MRTLAPLDTSSVAKSLETTSRLICVQESSFAGSWGASLIASLITDAFDLLDGPPAIIGGDDTPLPYAQVLEEAWIPSVARIADSIRSITAEWLQRRP
jgi:pyruvate dehydrogenase E1 component beta subunit